MVELIEQLTDAQRECLRLVLQHHNSKEIAVILGLSPSAVDKRIERAVQLLGATSRFAAARLLARSEGGAYERLPCEPIDVPPIGPAVQTDVADRHLVLLRRLLGLSPGRRFEGRARVELRPRQRLFLLATIIFLIAVTSLVLVDLGRTLSALVETYWPALPARPQHYRALSAEGNDDMLKDRRRAVDLVSTDFLEAEQAADNAALLATTCMATMLKVRTAANLPVTTGTRALQLVSDAASDLVRARQRLIEAHAALVEVRSDIGLGTYYGYGDVGNCPPNSGQLVGDSAPSPRLSVVA